MKITKDNYQKYIGKKVHGSGGMIKTGKRVYGRLEAPTFNKEDRSIAYWNLICPSQENNETGLRIHVTNIWRVNA